MRAPDFWAPNRGGVSAQALQPLGWSLDVAGQLRRAFATPRRATIPVVCVGNIVAGGAGKTPTALALAHALSSRGRNPHFVTRGYGGSERGPLRVDPERHTTRQVGDEALLLAREAPTWLAHDRVRGAQAAADSGGDIVIMDDGLQNPSLIKDLALVVIDGGFGFGNGHLVPAGPLREPVERGLRRANAIVLVGPDEIGVLATLPRDAPPLLHAELVPDAAAYALRDRAVMAFAGIGRPAKFFHTLEAIGCVVLGRYSFGDHHRYSPDEVMTIVETASESGAVPVTTEKDWVRLPADARPMVEVVRVSLEWRDPAAVDALLTSVLERSPTRDG